MAKSTTHKRLILLLPRSISHTLSEKSKGAIRETHPVGEQYPASRETEGCRKYMDTFMRRIDGLGNWETLKRFAILLIKICTVGQNKKKGIRHFDNESSILRDAGDFRIVRNSHHVHRV